MAGDTIQTPDYDNMVSNLNTILGTPADVTLGTFTATSVYGYNQSTLSLDAAPGETVSASNTGQGFKNLQDEVQALASFLSVSINSTSDVSAGDTITAVSFNNLMDDVKTVWDNRLDVPVASTTSANLGASSRTTGWGSSATPEVTHEFSVTFSSETHARGFFNAGGRILFTGSRTGGTTGTAAGTIGSQNADWTALLSGMGTLTFDIDNLVSSGATGTSAGKGFYELGTAYAQLYIKYGAGAYASNFYKIEGKINSTTNPTVITFKVTMRDDHALNSGALGPDGNPSTGDETSGYVDAVDGTLTSDIDVRYPNSNGITLAAPTYAAISNL